MPVKVKDSLPAVKILEEENIFMMSDTRATTQDIRPLRIVILNLMPTKVVTETQLLRRISNTPLQIEVSFLRTSTYQSHNTTQAHLDAFYKTFEDIQNEKFDGLIITGAPVEHFEFEEVTYWKEITHIMDWANTHVFSTLYICWAAQAGLFYKYGVPKYPLDKKMFGVFRHRTMNSNSPITRGFDDIFYAPHSRHTEVRQSDIEKIPDLEVLAVSDIAGVYLVASRDGRHVFVTGHGEYDFDTLKLEYERDLSKGLPIEIPVNYFPNDDPSQEPVVTWRSHSNLLISNWLNYCVYQQTPFNLDEL